MSTVTAPRPILCQIHPVGRFAPMWRDYMPQIDLSLLTLTISESPKIRSEFSRHTQFALGTRST